MTPLTKDQLAACEAGWSGQPYNYIASQCLRERRRSLQVDAPSDEARTKSQSKTPPTHGQDRHGPGALRQEKRLIRRIIIRNCATTSSDTGSGLKCMISLRASRNFFSLPLKIFRSSGQSRVSQFLSFSRMRS